MIRKILILLFALKPFRRIIPSLIRKLSFASTGNIIFLNDFKMNLFLTSSIVSSMCILNSINSSGILFFFIFCISSLLKISLNIIN